jgi:FKBP-type peptidyl-prolyl cis-trans isomerase
MKVGSCRTLILLKLGYGARGRGGVIPPNATSGLNLGLLGIKLIFPI